MSKMTPLRLLSLGAGVQSSTLAMMMREGEIDPADAAIFADTGDEPEAVYEYLEYLEPLLPFPLHIVSAGKLSEDFLAALDDPAGRAGQPPFMVYNHEKKAGARLWRKCTTEYKLQPIRRKAQLRAAYPGCNTVDIRGNVDTRLRKVTEGAVDSIPSGIDQQ